MISTRLSTNKNPPIISLQPWQLAYLLRSAWSALAGGFLLQPPKGTPKRRLLGPIHQRTFQEVLKNSPKHLETKREEKKHKTKKTKKQKTFYTALSTITHLPSSPTHPYPHPHPPQQKQKKNNVIYIERTKNSWKTPKTKRKNNGSTPGQSSI